MFPQASGVEAGRGDKMQHKTHHGGQLAGDDLLLHLLGQRVLQCQVVSPVDEELVLQVLRRVEILAGRLLSVTPTLLQHSTDKVAVTL